MSHGFGIGRGIGPEMFVQRVDDVRGGGVIRFMYLKLELCGGLDRRRSFFTIAPPGKRPTVG